MYGFGVVLLEMLIGRRALDKSRPSREHNLVEWCRPLLNNNKKLLRILDARIDGQFSVKAMMKVANLGYQCLSQNPKGRPPMSQAVEVLAAVYDEERIREMALSAQNGSGVTLYEAPKENLIVDPSRPSVEHPSRPSVEKKIVSKKNEEQRTTDVPRERRKRREGRARSEPQNDFFSRSQSPEIRTHNRSFRDQMSK